MLIINGVRTRGWTDMLPESDVFCPVCKEYLWGPKESHIEKQGLIRILEDGLEYNTYRLDIGKWVILCPKDACQNLMDLNPLPYIG